MGRWDCHRNLWHLAETCHLTPTWFYSQSHTKPSWIQASVAPPFKNPRVYRCHDANHGTSRKSSMLLAQGNVTFHSFFGANCFGKGRKGSSKKRLRRTDRLWVKRWQPLIISPLKFLPNKSIQKWRCPFQDLRQSWKVLRSIEIFQKFHSQGMDLQQRDLRFTFTKQFFFQNDTRCWFQIFFIFTPVWGRFPCWLYNIFQRGCNHQPG